MTKNITKNLIVFSVLAALFFSQTPAVLAASFNNNPLDRPTFRALNLSRTDPTCRSCWVSSVTAEPGEIISFDVYYHNTSSETARDVKIRVNLPFERFSNRTISAEISADNAPTVFGSVGIDLSESRVVSIIPGSVRWFPDRASFGTASFPFSQSGDEIVNSNGLNIGNIAPGFAHQGHVAFKARVSSGIGGAFNDRPDVFTDNPSSISQTSAFFRAQVNPNNSNTTAWFNYGTTQSLGTIVGSQSIGSGNSTRSFSTTVSGLLPNTTYFVRAEAENSFGLTRGETISFRTLSGGGISGPSGNLPATATLSPTLVSRNSAILNGSVHPNNSPASAWFEWGRTEALGNRTESASIGSGNSFVDFTSSLTGLSANTIYFYRAVGQNSFGTTFGSILSFRTTGAVTPIIPGEVLGQAAARVSQVSLVSELDKDEVAAGETLELALKFENGSGSAIRNAQLKVILPSETELRNASEEFEQADNNVFNFNLGTIAAGRSGEITVRARVNRDVEKDSVLIFASTLNFTTSGGAARFVDSIAAAKVIEGGSLLGASLLDLLRGIFGSIWLYILLLLILVAYAAWYYGKKSVTKSELPG